MNKRPSQQSGPRRIDSLKPRSRTMPAPGHQPRRMSEKPRRITHDIPRTTKPYNPVSGVQTLPQGTIPQNPVPNFSEAELAGPHEVILNQENSRAAVQEILDEANPGVLSEAEDGESATMLPNEPTVRVSIDRQMPPRHEASIIIDDPELAAMVSNPEAGKVLDMHSDMGRNTLTGLASFHSSIRQRERQEQKAAHLAALEENFFNSTPEAPKDLQKDLFVSNHQLYCSALPKIIAKTSYEADRTHLEGVLANIQIAKDWDVLSSAVESLMNHPYQQATYVEVNKVWQTAKMAGNESTETGLRDSNDRIFSDFRNLLPASISVKDGRYRVIGSGSELRCELEVKGQIFVLEFNAYHQTIVDVSFPNHTENTPVFTKFIDSKLDKKTLQRLETTLLKIAENPDGYISKEPPAPETFALLQKIQPIHAAFQATYNATKANPDSWIFIESTVDQGKIIVTAHVGEASETFEVFGSERKGFFRTVQDFRIHSSHDAISGQTFDKAGLNKLLNILRKERESFIPPAPKVSFGQKVRSSFQSLWAGVTALGDSLPNTATRAQNWVSEKLSTASSWLSRKLNAVLPQVAHQAATPKRPLFQGSWVRKTAVAGVLLGFLGLSERRQAAEQPAAHAETIHMAHSPTTVVAPTVISTPQALPPTVIASPTVITPQVTPHITVTPIQAEQTITVDGAHGRHVTFVQALYQYLHSAEYLAAHPGYTPRRGDAWRMMLAMMRAPGQYEVFHRLYHNVHRGDSFTFHTVGDHVELTSWRHRNGHEHLSGTVSWHAPRTR